MRCSHCGLCCKETEMLLSEEDISLLEQAGYKNGDFARLDTRKFEVLRNVQQYCFFYDPNANRCKEYDLRPSGCRIYPVIFSEEDGVVVDDLCPEAKTVTKQERLTKGKELRKLLDAIDKEAKQRRLHI